MKVDYHKIENKWQKKWEEEGTYKFDLNNSKPLLYALEMFSYPSGAALHMGHWYNFAPADTWVRYKRMNGYNVFHPMGFDAFGLPAENYAIKTGIHPQIKTYESIQVMERQLKAIGTTIDWDYELITSDPSYYKWTQWMFLELYKKGLAYKKAAPVNYCSSCNTVLANEQVINGACERCGTIVERKKLNQWFFKITDYAEELLNDLDKLDWPERTKNLQRNWIGKSEGANVTFKVKDSNHSFEVFTTRVDTLYGCTYCVLAPENDLVASLVTEEQKAAVNEYIALTSQLSEIDRTSTVKEKTGVFTGSYAVNPINGREVPIWIADYVIASYGTGAVMAVPAHDERDFAFATKFNLDIVPVVKPLKGEMNLPYVEYGVSINSDDLSDINTEEMKLKVADRLQKLGMGGLVTTYKLRDWLVSRQRYWGAPIPIVYCDECGPVAVPETDLPVLLPTDVEFKPTGKSPLATSESFMHTTCPKCGKPAIRDADTLDTFVCSSWYYLRYPDNKNNNLPFNSDLINKMLPVDKYVGGIEHACMHLLYARFFTKALRDMGYLSFDEPFSSLVHQGIILGSDGEKMSKSKGNTVAPDEYIEKYGSDVLRGYLMFGFNYIDGGPWTDDGIKAIDKFYQRIDRLMERVDDNNEDILELDKVLNLAIKHIAIDIEKFQFNTCISRIMEYVNGLSKYDLIPKKYLEDLCLILAPFAPHVSEEWWHQLGNKESIHLADYPVLDPLKLKEDKITMVVQINGKVRANITVNVDITDEDLKQAVLLIDNIKNHIQDKTIIKMIIVPKKIINIVVK